MSYKLSQSGLRWLWVALIVLVLDRLTKLSVQQHFDWHESWRMTSFFNLALEYNTGAAFSFLHSASGWQKWLFGSIALLVSAVLLVWLKRLPREQRWVSIALALVVGGALGNLYDRLCYGYVIDFIQLHLGHFYWPVFNVADSAICIGAVMLALDAFFKRK
jgi:signal peptidase II